MRLYFDACCVNRLTDDQGQKRIRDEAEAIGILMGVATRELNVWVGSAVLEAEITRNPNSDRRADAQAILTFVKEVIPLNRGSFTARVDCRCSAFLLSTPCISPLPKAEMRRCFSLQMTVFFGVRTAQLTG